MDKSNDNDSQVLDSLAELEDFVLSQMRGREEIGEKMARITDKALWGKNP